MPVEAIEADVRRLADESTDEVIAKAIERLSHPSAFCSYAKHLPRYVALKKQLSRRRYSDPWRSVTRDEIFFLRLDLYAHPCKSCSYCQTRRKSWPRSSSS